MSDCWSTFGLKGGEVTEFSGESEEDEGVVLLFTVFVSFFSLTLHFAASFCYCIVSDCSSSSHLDGS